MTDISPSNSRVLKGHHVLLIMCLMFGTIITVNITMAFNAIKTFPGLVVKNSYVASQNFDRQRVAQKELGLTIAPSFEAGVLALDVAARQDIFRIEGTIGRATHARSDQVLSLSQQGEGAYVQHIALTSGYWMVRLNGTAADGTPFRQNLELFVK